MRAPHEYERRILVATMGLFPQIPVETVYGLAVREQPPFVPTEIHLLTTRAGENAARCLIENVPENPLLQMADDYGLFDLKPIPSENIHILRSEDGTPLFDINDIEDNNATADLIAALLKRLTADREAALHVSIAGGRKTMGFLLGYSLSLFGRPQDRLSHVLVDPRLESHPQFFYPRPDPETLKDRHGDLIVASSNVVLLADIPFVRLREGLPDTLLSGSASYTDAVRAADNRLRPPTMKIEPRAQQVTCHGEPVPLAAAEFAFVMLLAQARLNDLGEHGALRWDDVSLRDYIDIYQGAPRPSERTLSALLEGGIDPEWFAMRVSRANAAIRKALGTLGAEAYLLKSSGRRPYTRTGFTLPVQSIEIAN